MFTNGIRPLLDGDNLDQSNGVDSSGPAAVPAPGASAGIFTSITDSTGAGSSNVGSGPGSGGTTTVSTPGSGLVFVNTYAAGDTAAYEADIVAAEQTLESLFTNKVTLNITFAESNEGNNGDALSNSWPSFVNVSYATLKSALPASVDTDLPATDPNPAGGKDWALPEAYARMLGLSSSTPTTDDTVTLNSFYGWSYTQDIVNGIEHELTEGGMGRVGGLGDQNGVWSTMDLFRFSAADTPDYTDGRDGKTTYFSSNGVTLSSTAGLSFNNEYNSSGTKVNGGDTADWTQEAVFGSTGTGESLTLVQTELNVMEALGWKPQMQEDFWVASGAGNWWTVNTSDWEGGSSGAAEYVPITTQDAFIGFFNTAQVTSNHNETVNSIGTNTVSTLTIGNQSTFTATNGTVLNSTDTGTTVSGMLGTLNVNGGSTLVIGNTFDNAGTLTIGVNSGSGGNGNLQILGSVTLSGGGTVNLGQYSNQTFSTGTVETYPGSTQFFVNGALTNVNNTITGGGTIALYSFDNQAGGAVEANQAEANYLQIYTTSSFTNEGAMIAETRATLDLGKDGATGSLTNKGNINLDSDGDLAISGTFTISGSGDIGMKGAGADIVSDGSGAATFINESVIGAFASGQIGDVGVLGANDLTFDNDDGTVFADGPGVVLTFNTGSHTITDNFGGLFEAEDGAQMVIDSNVNTGGQFNIITGTGGGGTIEAAAGSEVTISAAVAPGGSGFLFFDGEVLISGNGTIDVASGGSISTPITFSGSGGTLEVDSAADSITGQISGFAMGDFIDARFAPFGPGVTAQWQENGSDTGGVLSLVNGSSTLMTLNLAGVYTTAEFATLDDGHGGTTIELTGVPHDFNADGYSDILFQNVGNGNVYEWEMNGTSVIGNGYAGSNSNPQWQVVATGNFFDNGYSDILFENVSNGNVYEYEMNGTSIVTSGTVGTNTDPTWHVVATGDFTGNGYSDDILLQNVGNGNVYEYEMNGISVIGGGNVGTNSNPQWQVVATGDFFDNGHSDILFENVSSGNVYEYEMNGTSIVTSGTVGNNTDPTWHVVGTGDFTGNGIDDIIFQNSTSGEVYEWQMNGTSVVASGLVGNNTDPTWQVVGTGDFTGTHTAGILFENVNSGAVIEWQVNGFSVTNASVVGNNTNPAFHVVGTPSRAP